MAANAEILGIKATDIPISHTDNLNIFQPVMSDAEIIVKDILLDIFDTAVNKSEESQQRKSNEKNYDFETGPGDLIDLTRNYKQEFRTILRNLKCHKSQSSSNSSLEDQIKKVIDEIKSLETSVRLNINQEGHGDIDTMSEDNMSSNSNPIDYKSGITDFLNTTSDGKQIQEYEDIIDESIIQIIDLQPEDSDEVSSFTNQFPSEEDLEEVHLQNSTDLEFLNNGDRSQNSLKTKRIRIVEHSGGESGVQNPVPDPEPAGNLEYPKEGAVRKKKSLGRRLWHFLRKSSRPASFQSENKKCENNS